MFSSELSRRHRVLYVEPPIWSESEEHARAGLHFYPLHPNLYSLSIHLPAALEHDPKAAAHECRRLLAEALAEPPLAGNFAGAVQWFGGDPGPPRPTKGILPDAGATVYDAADRAPDTALLARANVVFTASEGARALAPGSVYLPAGVTARHFGRTQSRQVAVPNDMNFVPRPVLGYFGTVDERLDYALIAALADADPNWSLVHGRSGRAGRSRVVCPGARTSSGWAAVLTARCRITRSVSRCASRRSR